jgi:hypothetical protein
MRSAPRSGLRRDRVLRPRDTLEVGERQRLPGSAGAELVPLLLPEPADPRVDAEAERRVPPTATRRLAKDRLSEWLDQLLTDSGPRRPAESGTLLRARRPSPFTAGGVAGSDGAEVLARLAQTRLVRSAAIVRILELHAVVVPPADVTDPKGAGWGLWQGEEVAAGTWIAAPNGGVLPEDLVDQVGKPLRRLSARQLEQFGQHRRQAPPDDLPLVLAHERRDPVAEWRIVALQLHPPTIRNYRGAHSPQG